jgi:hypothetical protein
MSRLEPGTEVGMARWPFAAAHPDAWGLPWKGVILDLADPSAWRGTLAFPRGEPDPEAIRAHLRRHPALGVSCIPVRWGFGEVHWEPAAALRPYAEDLAAWERARRGARGPAAFPCAA